MRSLIKHKYELQTDEAISNLREALIGYAKRRRPDAFVGQFLDEEGCKDGHFGIYGMASWLLMTADLEDVAVVTALRVACKDQLKTWTQIPTPVSSTPGPEKHEYELSSIISKIAFALEALSSFPDAHNEAQILQTRLAAAQHPDGGWGFLASSTDSNPFVTALVLRSVASHPAFVGPRRAAVAYLARSYEPTGNLYEQLYVLNALQYINEREKIDVDARKMISNTIRYIFRQVRSNPTAFPNPLNVDFHDSNRTRYFRFQTDLVLLEALLLMSGHTGIYLRAHAGRRLFNSLSINLLHKEFSRDTSGHRASVGAYLFTSRTLAEARRKTRSRIPDSLLAVCAWIACASAFGVNFTWSVVALTASGTGAAVAYWGFGALPWTGAFLGVGVKTLADALRSLWITYFGGDER
jgi:hypothetical protein